MTDKLLTVKQVAEVLACHRGTVYDLLASGVLPVIDFGRRMKRVRERDVQAYIDRCVGKSAPIAESPPPLEEARTLSVESRSLRAIQAALRHSSAG